MNDMFPPTPHRILHLPGKPRGIARIGLAILGASAVGCTGTAMDFAPKFGAIATGATRQEIAAIAGEPLAVESWSLAGLTLIRNEYADPASRYAIVMVEAPGLEPRVIGKTRMSHFNCR